MRAFAFATAVNGRDLFVRAETPSPLVAIREGYFDYTVRELFDAETDERLDPQIVNTVSAVDAMSDDAWLAALEATQSDHEEERP